ncbi:MAG TPA: helix-turn-helix domain-containing protein [Mycobacterium sp.]
MAATMYSAEDVAGILGLHVRTVRGYMRDGRLPAVRIGKQYRIAENDLREFTGGQVSTAEIPSARPRVEATTVVQIESVDRELMDRVTTLVMAGAVSASSGSAPDLHVQTAYDEARERLTVIAVGDPDGAARILSMVDTLVRDADR